MIPPLLGREFGAGLAGDEAAESARLTLELAGLVVGVDEIGDLAAGVAGGCFLDGASA